VEDMRKVTYHAGAWNAHRGSDQLQQAYTLEPHPLARRLWTVGHYGEVVRAADAGHHLFVEKPMSLYFDEALAMEHAIRRAGVIATAGFQMRYESGHTAIKEFLAGKRLVMLTWVMNGAMEAHAVKHTHTEDRAFSSLASTREDERDGVGRATGVGA